MCSLLHVCSVRTCFSFTHTATTEIYTLSLHDALPISQWVTVPEHTAEVALARRAGAGASHRVHDRGLDLAAQRSRSEEHTSELQSRLHLVCRLLLEKKKQH